MTDDKKKDKKDKKDAKQIDDEQLKDVAGGTVDLYWRYKVEDGSVDKKGGNELKGDFETDALA
ncbi:MAG: hypothetical protein VX764_09025 [Planctomycetota bacterium]|nr:hypothetical protein [Planctomycetota bacterium]